MSPLATSAGTDAMSFHPNFLLQTRDFKAKKKGQHARRYSLGLEIVECDNPESAGRQ